MATFSSRRDIRLRHAAGCPRRSRFVRPAVEQLEDRRLLSTLFALESGPTSLTLVRFESADPGTIISTKFLKNSAASFFQPERQYLDLDSRPATGQLYALAYTFTPAMLDGLSVIDPSTGHGNFFGNFFASSNFFGPPLPTFTMDFDPVHDQVRAVGSGGQNLRVDPASGTLLATDPSLAYAAGDANAGRAPSIGGIAYTNNVPGAATTTLYGIDTKLNVLVTQDPASAGALHTVGPLGVSAQDLGGFDIVTQGGVDTAYLAVTPSGASASQLYTVNLATGAATLVGTIGGSHPVSSLAAQVPGAAPGQTTLGTFDPGTGTWYLRSRNSAGPPDVGQFAYGAPGWVPMAGDWDGDGTTTIGVVDPGSGTWYVRNHNNAGPPDPFGVNGYTFRRGLPGWVPVTGDWKATGMTGIGTFDPTTGNWYLLDRAGNGASPPPFQYGLPGWIPVAGDWSGTGHAGIGVFDPSTGTWYLRNEADAGPPDAGVFRYGLPGWTPVAGDWDGDGRTTIGVVDPNGNWYLRNSNTAGPPDVGPFPYGLGSWVPVAADWSFPVVASQTSAGARAGSPDPNLLSRSPPDGVVDGALARLEGLASPAQRQVLLSADAGGWAWYVGPTPLTDSAFTATTSGGPLTADPHDIGHLSRVLSAGLAPIPWKAVP